jgi:hypothetical protein
MQTFLPAVEQSPGLARISWRAGGIQCRSPWYSSSRSLLVAPGPTKPVFREGSACSGWRAHSGG